MPYAATLKMEIGIDKGPQVKLPERKIEVDAYLPVSAVIPPTKGSETTEVVLEAGSRDRIKFVLVSAGAYADASCPRNPVGLVFQISAAEPTETGNPTAATSAVAPAFDANAEVISLDAPVLFAGHTLGMLPAKVSKLLVKNYLGVDTELNVLVGKVSKAPKLEVRIPPQVREVTK